MFKKHRPPVGSRPGTLIDIEEAAEPRIHVIDYSFDSVEERDVENSQASSLAEFRDRKSVTWVDVQGLGDVEILKEVGDTFGVHPLALEDVVNIPQRPKAEEYDDSVFVITCMITAPELPEVEVEQISIFVGSNFVVSFQERYGDVLEQVRNRIRQGKGPIRKSGADYLAYALMDAVIDAYYPVLEDLGEYLEELETVVIEHPTPDALQAIYRVRRELLVLRRSIFPQRELLSALIRDENLIFRDSTTPYLRDCYDHCAQVIDVLETYREICGGLMDVYLSGLSNKMNEVMKVLTIIATIFIPLSFLAGIYGMNFEHMPELHYKWSYPLFWIVIFSVAAGMLFFFKKLGWLDREEHPVNISKTSND